MFHSTGDVVSNAEPFILDFGAAYKLDKFEYYPRDNYSNGTVSKMDIYTSLDGLHWVKVHNGDDEVWTYNTGLTVIENVQTVDLSGNAARYVKLVVKASVGNFFAANELVVYKEDGTEGFAVGSTNLLPAVTEADYTNMMNYKGTSIKDGSSFVDQIQKRFGDINYNEIYDVYDYAFTAFPLNRGPINTGSVSGNARYDITEENGNLVIEVVADRVRNVNAFGEVLHYDPGKLEFVSVVPGDLVTSMEDFSVNMEYDDGTAYVNLAYFNKGAQNTINGSGVLATITMRRNPVARSIDANGIDLSSLMLIGPDYSLLTIETDGGSGPITKYGLEDVSITMTNEFLPTDDGSNITKLIQQGNYDGLFDGHMTRDFEFLWDWEGNYDETGKLPEYVALPVTMHVAFNEPSKLTEVTVSNANKSNGFVTKAEAVLNYSDGTTSKKIVIDADLGDYAPFDFAWVDNGKTVTSVDITILEAINYGGESVTNMLTLAEMELVYTEDPNAEQPHEHTFGEWTTTKEATCTEDGSKERVCACGEKEIEVVPALGHDFVNGDCKNCDEVLTSKFEDVPVGAFYFDPVEWAVAKGVTNGATATTFNPNGNCQRAQVVTFLWRAAGSPEPTSAENPFKDVKESDFYYKAVLWAVENGITNGLTADTFGPFALCNRAQVVTFLWRAMEEPAVASGERPFTDVDPAAWYGPAVLWAVENGITNGMGDGTFGVGTTCNRAQVVTFLYRTMAS